MRVAIYCRISTDEDLQRYSLSAQEKELREFTARKGYEIAGVYKDTISGSKSNRPGLDTLRDDMAAGKFDAVLCVDQDRLSRLEPIDWELLKKEMREAGVVLVTPAQTVNFEDEDSELVSDVFNLFARHQRRKLKKAMLRGRLEAVKQGKHQGKPPFGYRKVDGKLVPDPETSLVVQKIFAWYAEGWGGDRIAKALKEKGLPAPRGTEWQTTTVIRIITNRVYAGILAYSAAGQYVEIPGHHEPLVDEKLFAVCNRIYYARKDVYRKHHAYTTSRGLLSDVLYCAECGEKLQVKTVKSRRYIYNYYKHRNRTGQSEKCKCKNTHRVEVVDAKLINAVKKIAASPEAARELIYIRNTEQDKKMLQARLKNLEKAKEKLQNKLNKLLELYLDTAWEKSFLDAKKREIEAQIRANNEDQKDVRDQLLVVAGEKIDIDYVAEYFAAIANFDTEMTYEQQKTLVRALIKRAELNRDGALYLKCRIEVGGPGGPDYAEEEIQSQSYVPNPDEKGTESIRPKVRIYKTLTLHS
ncbi:MAG: recombinase family protein [Bacillota bacterium]|nr:recombinase family protein [Bacillota bacterium]